MSRMAGKPFLVVVALVIAVTKALPTTSNDGVCMKDILVLLDTSFSIGRKNFDEKVKPFLRQLVNDPSLNVSPEGTHIAFVAFSTEDQTKVLLPFDPRGYDTSFLNATIKTTFVWEKIKGGQTRTDLAFQKASEIFKDHSPLNHRATFDDVVLLITDGEPHGIRNAKKLAIQRAKELKDHGVTIVGVGVGNVNMDTLRDISTQGLAHESTFANIHTILEELIAGSCQPVRPAEKCECAAKDLGDLIIGSDSSTRIVSWDIPKPTCTSPSMEIALIDTIPNMKSGDLFPIGRQKIEYLYSVSGRSLSEITCDVSFEVKGSITWCRGETYSTDNQVCCCGAIHNRRDNYECCGIDYFSKATKKCCGGSTVRNKDQSCWPLPCKCPAVSLGTKYMKEGTQRTSVTWTVPRPTCGGRVQLRTTVPENTKSGQSFTPGVYTVKYLYRTGNQFGDITCLLNFEVKACSCPVPVPANMRAAPGDTTTAVTWSAPLPSCPEAITNTVLPAAKSGQSFSIGQHTILYTYTMNNQFDMRCGIMFEVRGALCRDKGYDPSKQVCCCGTVQNVIPGYDCCGQDYYSLTTHKCCSNSVVRHKAVSCPRD